MQERWDQEFTKQNKQVLRGLGSLSNRTNCLPNESQHNKLKQMNINRENAAVNKVKLDELDESEEARYNRLVKIFKLGMVNKIYKIWWCKI